MFVSLRTITRKAMEFGVNATGRRSSYRHRETVAVSNAILARTLVKSTVALWIAVLSLLSLTGCQTLSLPAIDPTGNRIFSNATTTLINPHDPNNGYPSTQPAFQAPPNPPKCLANTTGTPQGRCKGCLAGTGCLGRKKAVEEIRGKCGQLLLTPTSIVAPVGGEVILLAGICGKDEYLVTNEPIEWMLAPDGVGQIVEVGDDAKGQKKSFFAKKETGPKVEKVGIDFARVARAESRA